MVDLNKLGNLVKEKGIDQTEATTGGGGTFEVAPEGIGFARLVSYIEIGKHAKTFKDRKSGKEQAKEVDQVILEWELSGKKYPPANEETGRTGPFIVREFLTLSTNEKAIFYKLFKKLNWEGAATHMVQIVGKPYKIKVTHNVNGERTYVNLKDDDGYNIDPPFLITETEEGETVKKSIKVPDAVSPFRVFLWDLADKEQWDSLFIDGKYDDREDDKGKTIPGKSKNWIQEKIASAINFKGSPASAFWSGEAELELDTDPDTDELDKADKKGAKKPKDDTPPVDAEEDELPF